MRTIALSTQAWVSFVFAGSLLSLASPTAAQSCETDSDCGAGYVCHTESYEGCSGMTCKPDEMCPPPTCETYESKYCVSAPCSADADCPGGMVCYAPTYQECSGGSAMTPPCDPGAGGCDVGEPVDAGSFECHDVTGDATCTPRYQLPCSVAADCGAGFACEEQIYTVCSSGGMGGAPAMRPDVAPPVSGTAGSGVAGGGAVADAGKDDSFECHEENSGTFYCRLLELPCDSGADCGEGLECQNNPYVPGCGGGSTGGAGGTVGVGDAPAMMAAAGSSADDGSVAADAGTPSCGPESVAPKVCAPHNYYTNGMYPGGGSDGSGNSSGGGTGGSSLDGGVDQPPSMGMGGSTGSGSAGMGGPTSGEGDSAGHGHDHHSAHHHHQGGHLPHLGCSVSGGDAGSQLASFFGLVGLVAFGLRRRTRRG